MKITTDEVRHVAKLARLRVDAEDIDLFAEQLGSILDYVASLDEIDTTGVPPTSHAVFTRNAFRVDIEHKSLDHQSAMANAPQAEDGFFVVPKIID